MNARALLEGRGRARARLVLACVCAAAGSVPAALPPVPTPAENPPSEAKRILGKALFWDEQLSSDDDVACGSCHRPASGGADPRAALHPGPDGLAGTSDDVRGSLGVRRRTSGGQAIDDPVFGDAPQVTARTAPSIFTTLWADELFWDGRAGSEFRDPLTGELLIAAGGALEVQAIQPILDSVEMAREGREWREVVEKLEHVRPLALATELPADLAAALGGGRRYPQLFEAAFGDPAINPARIGFAIASYERTLVPDQTPWDRYDAGDEDALDAEQISGLAVFKNSGACRACHTLPLFSNDEFRNTGVRPPLEDPGRKDVTGERSDRGKFKVPSLRNAALRPRYMHNGRLASLRRVLDFYTGRDAEQSFPQNRDPHFDAIDIPDFARQGLLAFVRYGLTDPRVANEEFPFDRPRLRSEVLAAQLPATTEPTFIAHAPEPNPFRPATLLSFTLLRSAPLSIRIYAANGRLVRGMRVPERSVGWQGVRWNGRDDAGRPLASGVYHYEMRSGAQRESGRVTLLR